MITIKNFRIEKCDNTKAIKGVSKVNISEPIQNGIAQSYINDLIHKTQKETVKQVTENLKNYFEDKLVDEFGNITTDIDEIKGYINDLLKEYKVCSEEE